MQQPANSSSDSGREPDWTFSFGDDDGTAIPAPPAAIAGEIEFTKVILQRELDSVAQTALKLQSLLRRAHGDGMSIDDLAAYSSLSIETATAVVGGASLIDQLFSDSPDPA